MEKNIHTDLFASALSAGEARLIRRDPARPGPEAQKPPSGSEAQKPKSWSERIAKGVEQIGDFLGKHGFNSEMLNRYQEEEAKKAVETLPETERNAVKELAENTEDEAELEAGVQKLNDNEVPLYPQAPEVERYINSVFRRRRLEYRVRFTQSEGFKKFEAYREVQVSEAQKKPVSKDVKGAPKGAPTPAQGQAPAAGPTGPEAAKETPLESAVKKFEKAVRDGKEDDVKKALDEINGLLPQKPEDRTKLVERLNKALAGNEKFKYITVGFDKSGELVFADKKPAAEKPPEQAEVTKLKEIIKLLKEFFEWFFKKEKEARCGNLRDMPTAKDHLEELKEKQRQLREKAKTDPKAKKELDEVTEQINKQEAAVRRMEEQKKRNEEAEQKLKPHTTDNPQSGIRTYRDQFGNLYMIGKTDTEFTASVIVEQERTFVREAWRGQRPRGYRMPVVESAYVPVSLQPTISNINIGTVIQGVEGNVTVTGDNIQAAAAAHYGESPGIRPMPTATAEAPSARPMPPRTTPELRNMPPRNPPAAPTAPSRSIPVPTPPGPTGSHRHG